MKKTLLVVILVLSILSLTACGDIYIQMPEGTALTLPDGTVASTVSSEKVASAEVVQAVAPVQATPEPLETAAPVEVNETAYIVPTEPVATQPEVEPAPSYVYVTKNPYSENVAVGGSCMFIAYAANSTSVSWTLVDPTGTVIYNLSDGPYYFPGLCIGGNWTNTIYLSNIPSSLGGWRVQACFTGYGGPVYTDMAYIYTYYPESCPPCPPQPPCSCCGCCNCTCGLVY